MTFGAFVSPDLELRFEWMNRSAYSVNKLTYSSNIEPYFTDWAERYLSTIKNNFNSSKTFLWNRLEFQGFFKSVQNETDERTIFFISMKMWKRNFDNCLLFSKLFFNTLVIFSSALVYNFNPFVWLAFVLCVCRVVQHSEQMMMSHLARNSFFSN